MAANTVARPLPQRMAADLAALRPPDARVASGLNRLRQGGPVSCVAFASSGEVLASASDSQDSSIRFWDTASGKELRSIEVKGPIFTLTFSGDGNMLAAAGEDKLIRLWEARSGKGLRILPGHAAAVSSLAFSRDARELFSADYEGMVRQWDTSSGLTVGTFAAPGYAIHALALSADGKTLAAGLEEIGGNRYHPIRVWDLATRAERSVKPGHTGYVWAVAFSPDGKTLASAGGDGSVFLWSVASGELVREFCWQGSWPSPVRVLAFSPKEKTLAAGRTDSEIHIWDTTTGHRVQVRTLKGGGQSLSTLHPRRPFGGAIALAFSADGRTMATGSGDQRIRLWDGSMGRERLPADQGKKVP